MSREERMRQAVYLGMVADREFRIACAVLWLDEAIALEAPLDSVARALMKLRRRQVTPSASRE